MGSIRLVAKADTVSKAHIELVPVCPLCNIEMRLFGIEAESKKRDLYTFECVACGGVEVRGVKGSQSVN